MTENEQRLQDQLDNAQPSTLNDMAGNLAKQVLKPGAISKFAAKLVVGHSVRFCVSAALVELVPVESRKDKVRLTIATYAISGMVSGAAKSFIESEIDGLIEVGEKLFGIKHEIEAGEAAAEGTSEPIVHTVTTL